MSFSSLLGLNLSSFVSLDKIFKFKLNKKALSFFCKLLEFFKKEICTKTSLKNLTFFTTQFQGVRL
ncbi:hypothetical protein [Campylobacter troglodytis]|uniref:hypothetical protein n=1 Tax=Campylobacter troglodytis TaxID=654363 RepID=UPI0011578C87|nr:hypothetical protein [Campylobacter troglodytis]TQR60789.1 hypothetical protein DMC01_04030 [Campylobacter troglodytis]